MKMKQGIIRRGSKENAKVFSMTSIEEDAVNHEHGPDDDQHKGSLNWKQVNVDLSVKTTKQRRLIPLQVREDHLALTALLQKMDLIFSPFVFNGVLSAAFQLTLQIYKSLLPSQEDKWYDTFYFSWSIFHFALRNIDESRIKCPFSRSWINLGSGVAISTILIHEYGKAPLANIQGLEAGLYDKEVERFEKHLRFDVIGMTGLGCFFMTRSFILGMSSFIFTIEILLLQSEEFHARVNKNH